VTQGTLVRQMAKQFHSLKHYAMADFENDRNTTVVYYQLRSAPDSDTYPFFTLPVPEGPLVPTDVVETKLTGRVEVERKLREDGARSIILDNGWLRERYQSC